MPQPRTSPGRLELSILIGLALIALGGGGPPTPRANPLANLELPEEWETRFWASPDAQASLTLDPKALARLVPEQAGLRFCPCPSCGAGETDDPLAWSIRKPDLVTCKRCGASFPNEKIPNQVDKKVPEETIEVEPGIIHHYPYHAVDVEKQRYPEDRLYLGARRDYEAREFLSKLALYAALRHRRTPADSEMGRRACVLLIRFAQVYPRYAIHLDQPGRPKFLEPAHRPPPYRRGYGNAKWDWSGSLDVPINLAMAYGIVRDDPSMVEAGKLLGVADPRGLIERDLFRASAQFVADQPIEDNESALQAIRGMLVVGRLLGDPKWITEATARLAQFAEKGFYLDGLWRQGDATSHQRVLAMLEGWIARLMTEPSKSVADVVPMLGLARSAGGSILTDAADPEVFRASWPAPEAVVFGRRASLLGGSGVALTRVGEGSDSLELELRGMGGPTSFRSRRQAIRLLVGGRPVLGDLDDLPSRADGWDRASSSHNTVLVDGLNQRESIRMMRESAAGGDFLFFGADPDFQVAALDDPRAYPRMTDRYRQTVVVSSGPRTRYAVSVFEVDGGSEHDQLFHAPPGSRARWAVSVPMTPWVGSLLPPSIPFLPRVLAEDGRWFVQSMGQFTNLAQGTATKPATALLAEPGRAGVRLHFLGDAPVRFVTGSTPIENPDRSALMIRRRSEDDSPLNSVFVTVFEPTGGPPMLTKVGRMTETPGFVVLYLETIDGPEHLVINLQPGTSRSIELADGRTLTTDGRVVRARRNELVLAGGTIASTDGIEVRQPWVTGRILASTRYPTPVGRGWFETDALIPDDPALIGRTLLIRHGDGTTHGWLLKKVEPAPNKRVRLYVHEEPGFLIEGNDRAARYYQFPGDSAPGPHLFSIALIRR